MEVLSSLHSTSVSRLRYSWELVSPKLMEEFERLGTLMSSKNNYKNYRATLQEIQAPYVPFIAVFLTDFTYLVSLILFFKPKKYSFIFFEYLIRE
jgi:hypothetical protein